jgi:aminoglycoside phosphotransferase (APT) family kinase protein
MTANAQETFSGTMPVSSRQSFDLGLLSAYLEQHVQGFKGPLTIEQFKGGQSNPTFKLNTPSRSYVMRCKPGPVAKLLPSAHAIEREYRVMHGLRDTQVPVAQVYCLCEDESVIGRAFFIMEFVQGRIIWEQSIPEGTPTERFAMYSEMNRVIAAMHQVDLPAAGLSDYGKPGNYFERQISRWTKQYKASETEKIDAMDRLMQWLPSNIPPGEETSLVHGDFRLDNTIFDPVQPKILAVLDWELSTIGHPLADFSYHCMGYHISPGQFRGIAGLDHKTLGIPTEREYIDMYCQRTNRQGIDHWDFYIAYNLFRLAGILQGIAKRVVDGTAASEQGAAAGKNASALATLGWNKIKHLA